KARGANNFMGSCSWLDGVHRRKGTALAEVATGAKVPANRSGFSGSTRTLLRPTPHDPAHRSHLGPAHPAFPLGTRNGRVRAAHHGQRRRGVDELAPAP